MIVSRPQLQHNQARIAAAMDGPPDTSDEDDEQNFRLASSRKKSSRKKDKKKSSKHSKKDKKSKSSRKKEPSSSSDEGNAKAKQEKSKQVEREEEEEVTNMSMPPKRHDAKKDKKDKSKKAKKSKKSGGNSSSSSSSDSSDGDGDPLDPGITKIGKPFDGFYVMCSGQIESAEFYGVDNLYCKYTFYYGQHWTPVAGVETAVSQISRKGREQSTVVTWNFPIEVTFRATNAHGWPRLVLSIYSIDMFGRDVVRGYGSIAIPPFAGQYVRYCRVFKPRPASALQSVLAWVTVRLFLFDQTHGWWYFADCELSTLQ